MYVCMCICVCLVDIRSISKCIELCQKVKYRVIFILFIWLIYLFDLFYSGSLFFLSFKIDFHLWNVIDFHSIRNECSFFLCYYFICISIWFCFSHLNFIYTFNKPTFESVLKESSIASSISLQKEYWTSFHKIRMTQIQEKWSVLLPNICVRVFTLFGI